MGLEYKQDVDLEFLRELSSEYLDPLVRVLTLIKNRDGDLRWTQELTHEDRYIRHSPDHHQYWDLVAAEFVKFGSHTLGRRRSYRQILCNVCDKQDVNYNRKAPIERIEEGLLARALTDRVQEMTEDELRSLIKELDLKVRPDAGAVVIALQALIRSGGFPPYQMAVILLHSIANALGLTLPFVAYTTLTRLMSIFASPLVSAGTVLWWIGRPAYRVIQPATVMIACLRATHKHEQDPSAADE